MFFFILNFLKQQVNFVVYSQKNVFILIEHLKKFRIDPTTFLSINTKS